MVHPLWYERKPPSAGAPSWRITLWALGHALYLPVRLASPMLHMLFPFLVLFTLGESLFSAYARFSLIIDPFWAWLPGWFSSMLLIYGLTIAVSGWCRYLIWGSRGAPPPAQEKASDTTETTTQETASSEAGADETRDDETGAATAEQSLPPETAQGQDAPSTTPTVDAATDPIEERAGDTIHLGLDYGEIMLASVALVIWELLLPMSLQWIETDFDLWMPALLLVVTLRMGLLLTLLSMGVPFIKSTQLAWSVMRDHQFFGTLGMLVILVPVGFIHWFLAPELLLEPIYFVERIILGIYHLEYVAALFLTALVLQGYLTALLLYPVLAEDRAETPDHAPASESNGTTPDETATVSAPSADEDEEEEAPKYRKRNAA